MNIINKLTLKHMILNKKRTIVTIIGVIISVSMITAVSVIVESMFKYLGNFELESRGRFHVAYTELSKDDISVLADDTNTASIAYEKLVSSTPYPDNMLINEYAVSSDYDDIFHIDNTFVGHFPEKKGEIMISRIVLEALSLDDKEVGDLIEYNGNTYTICGILNSYDYHSLNDESEEYFPTYAVYTYLNDDSLSDDDILTAYIENKNITKSIYDDSKALAKKTGSIVGFNETALVYYGISSDKEFNVMLTSLASILIIIIMISTVSLIGNSFNISISERCRHLGMLASIGATKRQKRRSVFFEGFLCCILSIPLGIFFGIAGISVTFKFIDNLLTETILTVRPVHLTPVINSYVIIAAVLISILTVFLSAYIPSVRASKISPIDAIRQTKDINITKKSIKTSFITKKLFGFEGDLALKNLKRNKKRYRITIFSLFISILLFMTVYSYTFFLKRSFTYTQSNENYDLCVSTYPNNESEHKNSSELISKVFNLSYVTDRCVVNCLPFSFSISLDDYENDLNHKYFDNLYNTELKDLGMMYEEFESLKDSMATIGICCVDEKYLSKYLESVGKDYNDFVSDDSNAIILDRKTLYIYGYKNFNTLNLKEDDSFDISIGISDYESDTTSNIGNATLNTYYRVDDIWPLGLKTANNDMSTLVIVTPDFFNKVLSSAGNIYKENEIFPYVNIYANISDINKIEDSIANLKCDYEFSYLNMAKDSRDNANIMLVISIFAYGFISLMTLICVVNIFNTISTNMALRTREFATLRSVGMTSVQFNRMIAYESVFYGLKSLIYGIPFGIFISYLVYNSVSDMFEQNFVIPPKSILIPMISIFITVGLSMLYSSSKIKKCNIIDAIHTESI